MADGKFTCDTAWCDSVLRTEDRDRAGALLHAVTEGWAICPISVSRDGEETGVVERKMLHRAYCPKHRPKRRLMDRNGGW